MGQRHGELSYEEEENQQGLTMDKPEVGCETERGRQRKLKEGAGKCGLGQAGLIQIQMQQPMQMTEFRSRMSDFVSRGGKQNKENNVTQLRESVFFTPGAEFTGMDLTRSKISNLPGHKKVFLGDNLQMVVVMQGIEVERLRADNEALQVRVKEYQHKMFNVQNYQVQIRQLTEKLFELEREREGWSSENHKLTMVCQQLYAQLDEWRKKYSEVDLSLKDKYMAEQMRCQELSQEIERWRARYAAMEKSKNKELDDLRLSMQSQRKSVIDRQIRQLTVKFQGERGILEAQIRKLRELLESRSREMGQLLQKVSRLEMALDDSRKSQHVIDQLQKKLALLSQQVLRLNELVRGKHEEIESLRMKLMQADRQRAEFASVESQNKQLRGQLTQRMKELQEWRLSYSRLEQQMNRLKELSYRVQQLQNQIRGLTSQRERLSATLRVKLQEIESWRVKFQKQSSQMSKFRGMDNQLEQAQNKITMLSTEIQRLNQVLMSRMGEIDQWKSRSTKLEASLKGMAHLEQEYSKLSAAYTSTQRSADDLKARLSAGQSQRKGLEVRLLDYQTKMNGMSGQIDRLNKVIRGKMGEIDDWRMRTSKLQQMLQEHQQASRKLKEYQNQVVLLTQQIERLNGVMRIKCSELDSYVLKFRSLEQQIAYYRTQESKIKDYESRLGDAYRSVDGLRDQLTRSGSEIQRLKSFELKYGQLSQQMAQLTSQINRLNDSLKKKYAECEEFVSSIRRYEVQITRLKDIEGQYSEVSRRMGSMSQQLDKMARSMRDRQAEYSREKESMNKALAGKGQELDSMRLKVVEFQRWFESYRQMEQQLKDTQIAYSAAKQDSDRLRGQLSSTRASSQGQETKIRSIVEQLNVYIQFQAKYKEVDMRLQGMTQAYEESRMKIRDYEDRISDYEGKVVLLSQEIERIKGNLRSKSAECEGLDMSLKGWQSKYNEMVMQLQSVGGQTSRLRSENSNLQSSLKAKLAEYQQLRLRMSRSESQFRDYEARITDFQANISMLYQQIERLNSVLRAKVNQYQSAASECDSLRKLTARQVEDINRLRGFQASSEEMRMQMSYFQSQVTKLKATLSSRTSEYDQLKTRYMKLEGQFMRLRDVEAMSTEYSRKINTLSVEIEKLNRLLREKDYELGQEQKMGMEMGAQVIRVSAELERIGGAMAKTEQEYWQLTDRYNALQRSMGQYELERKSWASRQAEWDQRSRGYTIEIQRLTGLIRSNQSRLQELSSQINMHVNCGDKIKILSEEIDRLTQQNNEMRQDMEKLQLRFSETLNIEKRHQQFCMVFVTMCTEIESLRGRITEKDRQVETMRRSMLMSARVHQH